MNFGYEHRIKNKRDFVEVAGVVWQYVRDNMPEHPTASDTAHLKECWDAFEYEVNAAKAARLKPKSSGKTVKSKPQSRGKTVKSKLQSSGKIVKSKPTSSGKTVKSKPQSIGKNAKVKKVDKKRK